MALAAVMLAVGCGGSDVTETPQAVNLVGMWKLQTVGGAPLPYDIPRTSDRTPGDTYQVYGGSLEVTTNTAFYSLRDSTRYTSNGTSSLKVIGDDGYVTQNGNTLTMRSTKTAPTLTATLIGTSLHATRDAVDYVYTR